MVSGLELTSVGGLGVYSAGVVVASVVVVDTVSCFCSCSFTPNHGSRLASSTLPGNNIDISEFLILICGRYQYLCFNTYAL